MFYSWAFIIRAPLKKVSLRSGLAGPPHPTYLSPWQERLPLEVFQKTSNRDAIDFFCLALLLLLLLLSPHLRHYPPPGHQHTSCLRVWKENERELERESGSGIMKAKMAGKFDRCLLFVCLTSTGTQKCMSKGCIHLKLTNWGTELHSRNDISLLKDMPSYE